MQMLHYYESLKGVVQPFPKVLRAAMKVVRSRNEAPLREDPVFPRRDMKNPNHYTGCTKADEIPIEESRRLPPRKRLELVATFSGREETVASCYRHCHDVEAVFTVRDDFVIRI
eukprot:GHVT01010703.1.p1 GENE.GHVT01010703.1~~GHVT01010703.1.p1  ORF type:complete len:114 (+),score=9.30 GHVT01010703.1:1002-1343(+)